MRQCQGEEWITASGASPALPDGAQNTSWCSQTSSFIIPHVFSTKLCFWHCCFTNQDDAVASEKTPEFATAKKWQPRQVAGRKKKIICVAVIFLYCHSSSDIPLIFPVLGSWKPLGKAVPLMLQSLALPHHLLPEEHLEHSSSLSLPWIKYQQFPLPWASGAVFQPPPKAVTEQRPWITALPRCSNSEMRNIAPSQCLFDIPPPLQPKCCPSRQGFATGLAKYCSHRDKQAINVPLPSQQSSIQQPGEGWGTPAKLPCSSSQIFIDPRALFWRSLWFVTSTFPMKRSFSWKKKVL